MLLLLGAFALHAQTGTLFDCSFSETFTAVATGSPFTNAFGPCVSWRVTYSTTGITGLSIQLETSPDDITWTAIPATSCASVQPPCAIDGSNPMTTIGNATFAVRGYGKYVRLNVTSFTGVGSVAVTAYGYKGLTGTQTSSTGGGTPTLYADTSNLDAFDRLRSSSPTSIFSSVTEYDTNPLTWDTVLTGGGTATFIPNSSSRAAPGGHEWRQGGAAEPPVFVLPAGKMPVDRDDRRNGCEKSRDHQRIGYFDDQNGVYF